MDCPSSNTPMGDDRQQLRSGTVCAPCPVCRTDVRGWQDDGVWKYMVHPSSTDQHTRARMVQRPLWIP